MTSALYVAVRLLAMGGKARSLWLAASIAAIAAGTVWLVYVVWRSPRRDDLATVGSYAAAIAVIVINEPAQFYDTALVFDGRATEEREKDATKHRLCTGRRRTWCSPHGRSEEHLEG